MSKSWASKVLADRLDFSWFIKQDIISRAGSNCQIFLNIFVLLHFFAVDVKESDVGLIVPVILLLTTCPFSLHGHCSYRRTKLSSCICTRPSDATRIVEALVPHIDLVSFWMKLFLFFNYAAKFVLPKSLVYKVSGIPILVWRCVPWNILTVMQIIWEHVTVNLAHYTLYGRITLTTYSTNVCSATILSEESFLCRSKDFGIWIRVV